jgi:glycerophosphoryl diester phosphodiesterase
MEVIGHRGGAALDRENSLEAIRAGLGAGADGVEVDVRLSSDGVPVLMHDVDVARTTSGSGRVDEQSLADLRMLGVAALDDVLDVVPGDRRLIVELKGTPWEPGHDPAEPLALAVGTMLAPRTSPRLTVSSFNPLALAVFRAVAPDVSTGVLTSPAFDLRSNLAAAIEGGDAECHVPAEILDPDFVRAAHGAGLLVLAWTVNEPEVVRTLSGWGVDGVITDDPRVALSALGR